MRLSNIAAALVFVAIPTLAGAQGGNTDPNVMHACIDGRRAVHSVEASGACMSSPEGRAEKLSHAARQMKFVMINCFFFPTVGPADVELSKSVGMDELWYCSRSLSEQDAIINLPDALARAKALGGPRIVVGLTEYSTYRPGPYVLPYLGEVTTLSPRLAPLGDFLGSDTGTDDRNRDVRSVVRGKDQPGFLLQKSHFPAVAGRDYEPNGTEILRRYRLLVPLKVGPNWKTLAPSAPLGVITVELVNDLAEPTLHVIDVPILAREFSRPTSWYQKEIVFTADPGRPCVYDGDTGCDNTLYRPELKLRWNGVADLSVGTIDFQRWDTANHRPWTEALADDIFINEPLARYGRNMISFMDDLHDSIAARDRSLFRYMKGFFGFDEPTGTLATSWRAMGDYLARYFNKTPGFRHLDLFTNFVGPNAVTAANPYYQLINLDRMLQFNAPIMSFDEYFFNQPYCGRVMPPGPPCDETIDPIDPAFQAHVDNTLVDWGVFAARARAAHVPSQVVVAITDPTQGGIPNNRITKERLSLQVYLALSYGFDRIGFWNIADASGGVGEVIDAIKPIIPLYDQLHFVKHYDNLHLGQNLVRSITQTNGSSDPAFRIDVAEFKAGERDVVMFVNRNFLPAGKVSLRVELATDDCLVAVDNGHSSGCGQDVTLDLGPGLGRLFVVDDHDSRCGRAAQKGDQSPLGK